MNRSMGPSISTNGILLIIEQQVDESTMRRSDELSNFVDGLTVITDE